LPRRRNTDGIQLGGFSFQTVCSKIENVVNLEFFSFSFTFTKNVFLNTQQAEPSTVSELKMFDISV